MMLKILATLLFFTSAIACAADVYLPTSQSGKALYTAMIEGPIKSGDSVKLIKLVYTHGLSGVHLASPGGDVYEAMKIGAVIRKLRLSTSAPSRISALNPMIKDASNSTCLSACLYIFASGVIRFGDIVGVHRPYLPNEKYKSLSMKEAQSLQARIHVVSDAFLKEMGVPTEISDLVRGTKSDDMRMLTKEEIAKMTDSYTPEIEEWLRANCEPTGVVLEPDRSMRMADCKFKLMEKERTDARFDNAKELLSVIKAK